MKGAADGAFMNAPLGGNFGNGHSVKIVIHQRFPLQWRQFLPNDPLNPLQLYLPGKAGT